MQNLPNYRQIKVTYLGPTNNLGSRVKIFETKRFNDDKTESKVFDYDYEIGSVFNQAIEILKRNNFNPICTSSELDYYIVLCDCWGENFKSVKDLK